VFCPLGIDEVPDRAYGMFALANETIVKERFIPLMTFFGVVSQNTALLRCGNCDAGNIWINNDYLNGIITE
jgi:hypothetical protein